MVKSTVRFPESVVEEVESLVDEGHFESKSEFYRFATDDMLDRIDDDYTPETIDFEEIKREVAPEREGGDADREGEELPFLESAALVRRYVLRGNVSDAEDFIDHHYAADSRGALLLEELLNLYLARLRPPTARPGPRGGAGAGAGTGTPTGSDTAPEPDAAADPDPPGRRGDWRR